MKNELEPTYEEIRQWAYDPADEFYPADDWDIIVFGDVEDEALNSLVLEIASDDNCPKQPSFLHFLYVMTGSVVRLAEDGFDKDKLEKLNAMIAKAMQNGQLDLSEWAEKSQSVINNPEKFNYEEWFQ